MATDADLLADLLDGRLERADVPPELAQLGELASAVGEHITLVPPTPQFRAALREELIHAVGHPGGPGSPGGSGSGGNSAGTAGGSTGLGPAGGAGSAGAAGATSAAGGLSAAIAAVAATAVLATGTYAVTTESVPGAPLYGLKQGLESVQLAVADDHRDVELLVEFATERVREAVGMADTGAVTDLLDESERLLDDALALATAQGRQVEDLLRGYAAALVTLDSRTEDPVVRAVVDQLLDDIGISRRGPDPDAGPVPGDGGDTDGVPDGSGDLPDTGEDPGDPDEPGEPLETPSEGVTDDPTDDPLDGLDELDDPLDELDDPLDELEDQVDDTVDDVIDVPGS